MEFQRRPSTLAYMLRAFHPAQGLRKAGGFPPLRAVWRDARIGRGELGEFLQLTGLDAKDGVPLLYPHVFGFPLQMAILTHPAFPIPIWNTLQIRNHLLRHRAIPEDAVFDLETRVAGQRILEKGAEVDLHTAVRTRDEPMWESLNTFYYRGRFGEAGAASQFARPPEAGDAMVARWCSMSGVGRRFGRLSGDYNGIHLWRWYARLFGFRRAFLHPQLVLGQCLARLPKRDPAHPQRLDAWLKGPVYYDADVALHASVESEGATFALKLHGEERPAVLGRWYTCATGSGLLDESRVP